MSHIFRCWAVTLLVLLVLTNCASQPGAGKPLVEAALVVSPSPTATRTPRPTPTRAPTKTASPTPTTTLTLRPTRTATPTRIPTRTILPPCKGKPMRPPRYVRPASPTVTLTPAALHSPLVTPTPPITTLLTLTPTPPLTATPTLTATPALTATPVLTPTPSLSPTPTPTYPPPPEEVHVPILMYHYISALPEDADVYRVNLTVVPEMFDAQLRYLQEQGYQTVTLRDVYDALAIGRPLPEKPIVLTFDDGYKDAYTDAMPLLQKYGFVGEFFVLATPAHYESPQYLTWDEMRLMAEAGMSMQAHGRDHYDLTNRSYDFLVYQIMGVKEAVEAHTGQPVRFFCYPSGRYDDDTLAVVESAGYLGAVTTEWGATQRLDNRYTWPRVRINGTWPLETYAAILEDFAAGD